MDVTAISNKQKVQTENKASVSQSVKVNDEGVSFKETISATQKNEMTAEKNTTNISDKKVTNPIENNVINTKLDKTLNNDLNRVSSRNQNLVQNGEINNVSNKELINLPQKELNNVSNNKKLDKTLNNESRVPNKEVKALEQEINLIADINNSKKVKKTVDETTRFNNDTLLEVETVNKSKNKLSKNVSDVNSDKINNEKLIKSIVNTEKEVIKLPMSEPKPLKDEKLFKENKISSEINLNKKTTNVKKEAKSKISGRIKSKEADIPAITDIANSNKQLEIKPLKKQEQKVIEKINIKNIIDTDAVLTSFAETDRALSSSKTNDILKFIDTNLSTNNTKKTTKGSATGAASKISSKKSNDSINMTENDIKFFTSLAEKSAATVDTGVSQNELTLKDVEDSQQLEVSKALLNALKESRENNKSFRVDFDKDISVVLKVSREGKISAEFIPGDKVVEQYLKQNLPILKQKFEEDGLEYDKLSYREDRKKDQQQEERRNNRRNNKENGYE